MHDGTWKELFKISFLLYSKGQSKERLTLVGTIETHCVACHFKEHLKSFPQLEQE
jgi:hypothetical protein